MKRQSGAAKRKAKKQRREIEAKGRQTLEDCGWRILHPSSSLSEPSCGSSCGPTNSQLLGEVSEEPNSEHLTERQSERVQSDPDHPVSIADETHERYELIAVNWMIAVSQSRSPQMLITSTKVNFLL